MANLIFLALSLLHSEMPRRASDIRGSMFFPEEEGFSAEEAGLEDGILYLGQMDPIVIWKAKQYKDEELQVIALCTKKVLCDPYSSEDPVTSAQFFMENVCGQAETAIDLASYRREFVSQSFCSENGRMRFLLLPIDEDDLRAGIRQSVDAIRDWNRTGKGAAGRFWVDVHGGFRGTMTVLTGIISLLKIDGIVPDRVYSPRYDNKAGEMTLPGTIEEIEIFDFVSGMDNFINYGNADLLRTYFKGHHVSEYEERILLAIDKVALGTQCCDTVSYKQGLTELSRLLKEPEPEDSFLLGLFLNYIRDSYGDLLTKNRSTLMIVRRCVEKKLYQQALTFIEASMVEEIVKKGLLTFSIGNYGLEEVRENAGENSADYYLFDAFLKMGNLYPLKRNEPLKKAVQECARREQAFRSVLHGADAGSLHLPMDTYVNTEDRNNLLPFDKERTTRFRELPFKLTGINSDLQAEDLDALGIFLRFHQLLKRCRNAFNHGLSDRPALPDLLILINMYIDYADYLYARCNRR